MKDKKNLTKMEFILTLNDNIVVQRFFNVKGYNSVARRSLELQETIKEFTTVFEDYLREKTLVYMMDNYHQIVEDPTVLDTANTDGPEYFYLTIKIGDETICQRGLDAKVYPPKVRYTVDVRPQLKKLLKDLTDIFSGENFTTKYLEHSLV